jgi:hypothetical protein
MYLEQSQSSTLYSGPLLLTLKAKRAMTDELLITEEFRRFLVAADNLYFESF